MNPPSVEDVTMHSQRAHGNAAEHDGIRARLRFLQELLHSTGLPAERRQEIQEIISYWQTKLTGAGPQARDDAAPPRPR